MEQRGKRETTLLMQIICTCRKQKRQFWKYEGACLTIFQGVFYISFSFSLYSDIEFHKSCKQSNKYEENYPETQEMKNCHSDEKIKEAALPQCPVI